MGANLIQFIGINTYFTFQMVAPSEFHWSVENILPWWGAVFSMTALSCSPSIPEDTLIEDSPPIASLVMWGQTPLAGSYFSSSLLKKCLTHVTLQGLFLLWVLRSWPSEGFFIPGLPGPPLGGKSYTDVKKEKWKQFSLTILIFLNSYGTMIVIPQSHIPLSLNTI